MASNCFTFRTLLTKALFYRKINEGFKQNQILTWRIKPTPKMEFHFEPELKKWPKAKKFSPGSKL